MRKEMFLLLVISIILFYVPGVKAYDCVLTGTDEYYGTCNKNIYNRSSQSWCNNGTGVSCTRTSTLRDKAKECTSTCPNMYPESAKSLCRANNNCNIDKYDITYKIKHTKNDTCGETTIETGTGNYSVIYWHSWRNMKSTRSDGKFGEFETPKSSRANLGANQCRAYEGEHEVKKNGKTYYIYDEGYSRCCDSTKPDPGVVIEDPACWRKKISSTSYDYKWQVGSPGSEYSKVSNISSSNACEINNPNYCTISSVKNNITKEMNTCSANATFELQNDNDCELETSSSFYKVTCSEKMTVDFASNETNNIITLKAGQGFTYNVDLEIKKYCSGTFDSDKWNAAYNRAVSLVNRAKLYNDNEEVAYYSNILNDINNIVEAYNNWHENSSHTYGGQLFFNYKYKNQEKEYRESFISNDPNIKLENINSSSEVKLDNEKKVSNFNKQLVSTTKVSLMAPRAYIDSVTAEVLKTPKDSSIDGGNKFYTDSNLDVGEYNISINITIDDDAVTLKNNSCSLKIEDKEKELYRIINEKNPFVNSTRKIGINWKNDYYDFTGIIDSNKSPLYIFNLPKSLISGIKASNRNNTDAYLGTCSKPANMQDAIMQSICKEINKYDKAH